MGGFIRFLTNRKEQTLKMNKYLYIALQLFSVTVFMAGCATRSDELNLDNLAVTPGLTVQGQREGTDIRLNWGWVTYDFLDKSNFIAPKGFEILVSEDFNNSFEVLTDLDENTNTFLIEELTQGQTYYFAIRASAPDAAPAVSNIIMIQPGNNYPQIEEISMGSARNRRWGSWSPDGLAIAFEGDVYVSGNASDVVPGIFTFDMDQAIETQLTLGQAPDWSPAGGLLAFHGRSGFSTANEGPTSLRFYDMNQNEVASSFEGDSSDYLPAWSPDGQQLAFLSNREGENIYQIWTASLNSTALFPNRVFDVSLAAGLIVSEDDQYPGRPAWTTDGAYIIYARPVLKDGVYVRDIRKVPANGGSEEVVLNSQWNDHSPAYSPGGQRLAFISDRTGGPAIWVMDIASGQFSQLTDISQIRPKTFGLDWSPDGSALLFTGTNQVGKDALFVVK